MKRKLELTDQQLNIVLFALQKQSFELVNDLIKDIAKQLSEQQVSVEESKKE